MLLVGGLFVLSTAQAPRTQDASFDSPTMRPPAAASPTETSAPPSTTTTTEATSTTVAPIVYLSLIHI